MNVRLEQSWKQALEPEFTKPYFGDLTSFVRNEYLTQQVFPKPGEIFQAFELTPLDQVKVVILGQDPYHGPGQAHGLAFSVRPEFQPLPPSLINIYKELATDLGIPRKQTGDLRPWATQGVLLLNATLTVRAHQAGSHQHMGWEQFTDAAIASVNHHQDHAVFILWGNYAQKKAPLLDHTRHLVLSAAHPSPLSAHRGFFGSKPFSKANDFLWMHGKTPIDW